MKKYFICILIVILGLGCGKKTPVPDIEENIEFDLNVTQAVISISSSYDFKVTITQALVQK